VANVQYRATVTCLLEDFMKRGGLLTAFIAMAVAPIILAGSGTASAVSAAARTPSYSDSEILQGALFGVGPVASRIPSWRARRAVDARRVAASVGLADHLVATQGAVVHRFAEAVRSRQPARNDAAQTPLTKVLPARA
jgi:hypothetical protein